MAPATTGLLGFCFHFLCRPRPSGPHPQELRTRRAISRGVTPQAAAARPCAEPGRASGGAARPCAAPGARPSRRRTEHPLNTSGTPGPTHGSTGARCLAQPCAMGAQGEPSVGDGKEGVAGSSPAEALVKAPLRQGSCLPGRRRRTAKRSRGPYVGRMRTKQPGRRLRRDRTPALEPLVRRSADPQPRRVEARAGQPELYAAGASALLERLRRVPDRSARDAGTPGRELAGAGPWHGRARGLRAVARPGGRSRGLTARTSALAWSRRTPASRRRTRATGRFAALLPPGRRGS